MAMAKGQLFLILISFSSLVYPSQSRLSYNYYSKSCPSFDKIIQETVTNKQITSPSTAAGTVRLFFHDCLVNGCDASILVSSTPFNSVERDADINLFLLSDAFNPVTRAKTTLKHASPNTVSCADILAAATRDLVTMVGGPYYNVLLGRKDYRISKSSYVEGNLPRPTMPMSKIISMFAAKGFSVQEMVALSGAHTIGFSHCKEFKSYLYNDTHYNQRFAKALQNACADYPKNPTLSVFNDIMTPNKFDNVYFDNLGKGLGLLESDHGLYNDPHDKSFCEDLCQG
ncbi:PEROXIDASE 31 [Salix koriyanagi]|uniref:Peroxidase n=1 Tax=Salix koriyanagi TaxID=2511006 RepID=A0A9Q0X0L2_9ROSI|nr:PEROXIDASE 31 [Salix koriyanagi]